MVTIRIVVLVLDERQSLHRPQTTDRPPTTDHRRYQTASLQQEKIIVNVCTTDSLTSLFEGRSVS
jgi:hypothetical protein